MAKFLSPDSRSDWNLSHTEHKSPIKDGNICTVHVGIPLPSPHVSTHPSRSCQHVTTQQHEPQRLAFIHKQWRHVTSSCKWQNIRNIHLLVNTFQYTQRNEQNLIKPGFIWIGNNLKIIILQVYFEFTLRTNIYPNFKNVCHWGCNHELQSSLNSIQLRDLSRRLWS